MEIYILRKREKMTFFFGCFFPPPKSFDKAKQSELVE